MVTQRAKVAMPRLRLVEFRNDQGWSLWRLSDLVEFSSGGTPSKAEPRYWGGDIPWISASSMYEAEIADSDLRVTSQAIGNGTRLAPRGSLLVLVRGSMLFNRVPMGIAVIDVAFNQDVKALKIGSGLNARFLLNQLIAISPRIPIDETGIGAGKIETDTLANLPIYLPSEAEQQKIADCLTSLDEMIVAQGRKVEALKTHKRGLMQQLFPREGETRPRLRFPDFRDGQEWIARPLGELMVIGSSRRVHESDWTTTGVPFYRAREIVALAKGEPITPLFISETLYREFSGYTGEIEGGQLLVTGVGSIGIPYLVKSGDRFYFKDGNIIWLKNDQAELTGNFLLRLFESECVQAQIATMAGIGTVGTYTIDNARRTIVVFPTDKREQQCIADCLSSLDTRITAETSQLAALKTHKQGLMQQLFPAPEAATA